MLTVSKDLQDLLHPIRFKEPDRVVRQLLAEGYIEVSRDKNTGIPKKIFLQEDRVPDAYRSIGRMPRQETDREILELTDRYIDSSPTNRAFCADIQRKINDNRESVYRSGSFPLMQVLSYISLIENNRTLLYQDELSALVEGCNTHSFKNDFKSKVFSVMKKYGDYKDCDSMNQVLKRYRIIQKNYVIKMRGEGKILFCSGREFDLENIHFLFGIGNNDVDSIKEIRTPALITVENETVFDSVDYPGAMILYTGGSPGKAEIELIKKIRAGQYLHTGDIDAGGLRIFCNIKKETGLPFRTYMMDVPTYDRYKELGEPLTSSDRIALQKTNDFPELARRMLEDGVKLEQEHIWRKKRNGQRS